MSSPRSTYDGGYYAARSFADTPIYDSLVAERGTPQIAPIRVTSMYDTGSNLPALPPALPALPSGPSQYPAHTPPRGYTPAAQQPAPLQQAPAPYIPQQPAPRAYPAQQQPMQPVRPAAPRQMPGTYEDPYGHPYQGRGY